MDDDIREYIIETKLSDGDMIANVNDVFYYFLKGKYHIIDDIIDVCVTHDDNWSNAQVSPSPYPDVLEYIIQQIEYQGSYFRTFEKYMKERFDHDID